MKLRVQGDSIRLRITRPELARLQADGEIGDTVTFSADVQLDYRLSTSEDLASPQADFAAQTIRVRLPRAVFERWASTDEISIRSEQETADTKTLSILVEKDFACLTQREGEDDSDKFPNPDAGELTC